MRVQVSKLAENEPFRTLLTGADGIRLGRIQGPSPADGGIPVELTYEREGQIWTQRKHLHEGVVVEVGGDE